MDSRYSFCGVYRHVVVVVVVAGGAAAGCLCLDLARAEVGSRRCTARVCSPTHARATCRIHDLASAMTWWPRAQGCKMPETFDYTGAWEAWKYKESMSNLDAAPSSRVLVSYQISSAPSRPETSPGTPGCQVTTCSRQGVRGGRVGPLGVVRWALRACMAACCCLGCCSCCLCLWYHSVVMSQRRWYADLL